MLTNLTTDRSALVALYNATSGEQWWHRWGLVAFSARSSASPSAAAAASASAAVIGADSCATGTIAADSMPRKRDSQKKKLWVTRDF